MGRRDGRFLRFTEREGWKIYEFDLKQTYCVDVRRARNTEIYFDESLDDVAKQLANVAIKGDPRFQYPLQAMGGCMRAAIRIAIIVGLVYFGLIPETTYSLYQDPRTQLSNWHLSDEVPCMWLLGVDLAGIGFHECVAVLERLNATGITDAR